MFFVVIENDESACDFTQEKYIRQEFLTTSFSVTFYTSLRICINISIPAMALFYSQRKRFCLALYYFFGLLQRNRIN